MGGVPNRILLAVFYCCTLFWMNQLDAHAQVAGYHQSLDSFLTTDGTSVPIESLNVWMKRRAQILKNMQTVMGTLPSQNDLPQFDVEVTETWETKRFTRKTLTFVTEKSDRLPCDLYVPKGISPGEKRPGIVALHPTGKLGKRIVAGDGPRPNRQYGRELAERGYVVICPDYPSFGDYSDYDFEKDQYLSGTMKGIFNHMRCVDYLQSLDEVDNERIGVIGHSLGGHNAMFVATFDERIKVIVSSCGWTPFHDYYGGKLKGWTSARYMPLIAEKYENDPNKMPFDFHEIVAALAPRPFFSNSPTLDSNFDVAGVKKAIPKAKKIYQLYDAEAQLQLRTPIAEHDFPTEIRIEAYSFIDKHLKHTPVGGIDFAAELPRIKPVPKGDAVKAFQIANGFQIQQTAAEPLVMDPVAACFDADGKLYVVEMRGYSEQQNDNLGSIALLQDTDQDGVFDQRTIFADGLSWPTAIVSFDGGVFIGAAPNIYFMKDTNGDGVADLKTIVFTGFGKSNVQGLLNCFRWGLDNRIHGATSSSGGLVRRPDQPQAEAVNLSRRDFSFDPRKLDIRAEAGGAQHGMSFDDWGRKFVCSNSDHLQMIVYDDRYAARNSYLKSLPSRVSIANDGGQAPVFRTSPVEPWRIVRTRLRVSGRVRGPVEGGGRPAGYFTGSTGVTIYRGDVWPVEFHGVAIVGDVGSNVVHRKKLSRQGVLHIGSRIDSKSELVTSKDIWFRPVQFANAPDGGLHVLDMYREVIEHPKSLPPEIKQHLDLTSGRDRGRLYRIVPDGYEYRPTPKMSLLSSNELVEMLSHPNSWQRETASRLLFERQDDSVISRLQHVVQKSTNPKARLHSLYVLAGLKSMTADVVAWALDAKHPMIRVHALKLAELFPNDPAIRLRVAKLVGDESEDVRFQLAFTLGEFPESFRLPLLAQLLATDGQDQWIRFAVLTSTHSGAARLFTRLLENSEFIKRGDAKSVLAPLTDLIATQPEKAEAATMLTTLDQSTQLPINVKSELQQRFVKTASARGNVQFLSIAKGESSLETVMQEIVRGARGVLNDPNASRDAKLSAIRSMAVSKAPKDHVRILNLIDNRQPERVQLVALSVLSSKLNSALQSKLMGKLKTFSPKVRTEAQEVMLSSAANAMRFLDAVASKKIPASEISRTRLDWMSQSKNKELAAKAAKVRSMLNNTPRNQVVKRYEAALELSGKATKGRAVFRKSCAGCHRLENHGHALGPNLANFRARGKQTLLLNILDPNREVTPDYLNYILVTKKGQIHTGMLTSLDPTTVTLKKAEGKQSQVLRVDIDRLESTGQSTMPEGLEKELNLQQMADLLEYLTTSN